MRYLRLRTPSQRLNEAAARTLIEARSLAGGRRYRRFLIVGVARTGSTLLLNLLNAQPSVIAFGELFRGDGRIGWDTPPFLTRQSAALRALQAARPLEFLEQAVFRPWPREVAAVGFKLFYYHARSGPQAAVWDHLRDQHDLAVIHIKRVNVLEQYVSLRLAHATNVWSSTSGPTPIDEPLVLAPDDCRRHFEEVRAQEQACDDFFAGPRLQTVTYEALVADRASVMDRVAGHLGVRLEPAEATIVRQRSQPLAAAVANFAQLRDAFAGSEWEGFFRQRDTVLAGQEAA